MRLKGLAAAVALTMLAPMALEAQPVSVDINTASPLQNFYYRRTSSIGWYFTPTSTFFLNAIRTRFNAAYGPNLDRTVGIEVWSDRPSNGGALLRSAGFQSNSALGVLGGAGFAPILLQSGIQYFIGFRNVMGLGMNATQAPGSLSLGPQYFSFGPVFSDDTYEISPGAGVGAQDILNPSMELIGSQVSTVPEPATMALLATGLVAMGGAGLIRRRHRKAQENQ